MYVFVHVYVYSCSVYFMFVCVCKALILCQLSVSLLCVSVACGLTHRGTNLSLFHVALRPPSRLAMRIMRGLFTSMLVATIFSMICRLTAVRRETILISFLCGGFCIIGIGMAHSTETETPTVHLLVAMRMANAFSMLQV